MVISARAGTVLAFGLLIGCVASDGRSRPKLPHETAPEDEEARSDLANSDCGASAETTAKAFDYPVAEGALKYAMDRAWSCGLHTNNHFDLSLNLSWGNAGCVAEVSLDAELPSSISECLLRRFEKATVAPFSGGSPSVQVRMTNDRAWWTWL